MRPCGADTFDSLTGAVILKIAYGYSIEPHERDPLVDLVNEAMDQFGKGGVAGAWLVDTIPARAFLFGES
jgi:hypothetical protein